VKRFNDLKRLYKLVIIESAFLVLFAVLFLIVFFQHEKTEKLESLEYQGRIIGETIAHNSPLAILTRNKELIEDYLEGALNVKDIRYAAAFFNDKSLFTEKWSKDFKNVNIIHSTPDFNRKKEMFYNETEKLYEIIFDVVIEKNYSGREEIGLSRDLLTKKGGDKETIGYIVVGLSIDSLKTALAQLFIEVVVILLVVLFISILALIMVMKKFVKPLEDLACAATAVAEGDMNVQVEVTSSDELGALAQTFNYMIDRLKAGMERIEEDAKEITDLFEGAMEGVFILDSAGKIIRINKEMAHLLGQSPDELVGRNMKAYAGKEFEKIFKMAAEFGESKLQNMHVVSAEGVEVPIEVSLAKATYRKSSAMMGFARDVSERKKMELQLIQSEKMVSTGRLAAGVAHEVNNPLTIIKNYLEIMRMDLELSDNDARRSIDIIDGEIDRISTTIKGLLAFSRPDSARLSPVNIGTEISDMMKLVKASLKKQDIYLELDLDDSLPEIMINAGHIKQVLINLVNNARDAMPEGGLLIIKTSFNDKGVELLVEDNGSGIPDEKIKDVFSYFYTTKGPQGSGLGLAVSYGIINGYGGEITLENMDKGGVRARVFIPFNR